MVVIFFSLGAPLIGYSNYILLPPKSAKVIMAVKFVP